MRYLWSFIASVSMCLAGCQPDTGQSGTDSKATLVDVTPQYLTRNPAPGLLTPERINSDPSLDGSSLRRPQIAPSGDFVTLLQGRADNARQQDLWAYDLETGEGRLLVSSTDLLGTPEELSDEEKNRRERAREYGQGIISYSWAGDNLLLFPLGGDIYSYDLIKKQARQITATKGFESDAKVSKSGRYAAYIRENNLFIKNLETGLERQLSDGATSTIRNGIASFVVQEELGRSTGYWISPTENLIAYTQIDESPVTIENRIEFGAAGVENVSQRYPFAGTDNATVKLGIVSRSGGETLWADIGDNPDIYLTRVIWSADGQELFAGILSRDHKSHTLLRINPQTGASSVFFEETSKTWLNIRPFYKTLKDGSWLWTSERDGKRQLFRIRSNGEFSAITPDSHLVNSIACVNSNSEDIYFTGWDKSALERQIYTIKFDGSGLSQISTGDGRHTARFAKDCSRFIGTFSNPDQPPQTRAYKSDGTPLTWLNENALDANHPYAAFLAAHITPEYGQIPADDGTPMDYALYKPLDLKPGEKRPAVTIVYAGPGVQRVHKGWARKHFARMLAHHGFVVFSLDSRGATNRGKDFEDVLYRAMGKAEVVDQSAGARWLKSQPFVDADKMGVYGWSYGGYMTLHMLAQTDHYAVGVSGAPVTDWALYDTAYTERYLGDPNPGATNYTQGAYEDGSVFAHKDGLTEPVLLIHGMADDNVVFRHSIKLMDDMQNRGRHNMKIMTYPGEKHGFRKTENRIHRDRQILDFFLDNFEP